jgi:hypothetical protein
MDVWYRAHNGVACQTGVVVDFGVQATSTLVQSSGKLALHDSILCTY